MRFTRFRAWLETGNPIEWLLRGVWLFLFLLVNREEGKELVSDLLAKMDRYTKEVTEYHESVHLWFEKTSKQYELYMSELEKRQERPAA